MRQPKNYRITINTKVSKTFHFVPDSILLKELTQERWYYLSAPFSYPLFFNPPVRNLTSPHVKFRWFGILEASVLILEAESQRWQYGFATTVDLGCPCEPWGTTVQLGASSWTLGVSTDLGPPLSTVEGHKEKETTENTVDVKQSFWKILSVPDLDGL